MGMDIISTGQKQTADQQQCRKPGRSLPLPCSCQIQPRQQVGPEDDFDMLPQTLIDRRKELGQQAWPEIEDEMKSNARQRGQCVTDEQLFVQFFPLNTFLP